MIKPVLAYRSILLIFLLSLLFNTVFAETINRPKIGLVLGGGGARAGAHIGMLEILEEYRVPIDYVVGTSMGSFIGALYAVGYSPAEIKEIVLATDWDTLFSPEIPRENSSIQRKQDDTEFLIKYRLGIQDGKPSLPLGLVSPYRLKNLLTEITLPVATIENFDALPIPYRAVAADLDSGKQVVLQAGNLAQAVVTSMNVPGVFPPILTDGRFLVDGGIANNVPVSVGKSLDGDVLIVVSVGTAFKKMEDLSTPVDVLRSTIRLMSQENVKDALALLEPQDIFMDIDVGAITTEDYQDIAQTIPIGRAAARAFAQRLQRLSLSKEAYYAYRQTKRIYLETKERNPEIAFIAIEAPDKFAKIIQSRITTQPGDAFDAEKLQAELDRIFALGYFESIDFTFAEKNNQTGIIIQATEKATGTNFVRFGFRVEENFAGLNDYGLGLSYTRTPMNALGGELTTNLEIGSKRSISSEFYQPVNYRGSYFVALSAAISEEELNTFFDGELLQSFRLRRNQIGFDLGRNFSNLAEFRLGLSRSYTQVDSLLENPLITLSDDSFNNSAWTASLRLDSLDQVNFPKYGSAVLFSWEGQRTYLGSDVNRDIYRLELNRAFTRQRNTLLVSALLGTTVEDNVSIEAGLPLGGFLNLSGFQQDELRGSHVGLFRTIYFRKLNNQQGALALPIYAGFSLEAGNAWNRQDDITFDNTLLAGSLFIGLDTPIAPIYFAGGLTEDNRGSLYLFFGRPF